MPVLSMLARGTLIAALLALLLAIGIVAEQERLTAAALQGGAISLAGTPTKLRIALGLLLAGFAVLGYLLFTLARNRPPSTSALERGAAVTLEAEAVPEAASLVEVQPKPVLMPSTEAGQMMAAGGLIRRLSHELNNALGPVQGFAELLRNDQHLSEPQRRQVAKIAEATAAALRDLHGFAMALSWSNDRAAVVHLGAVIRSAAVAAQSALGRPIPVSLKSETDVPITATEAQAGQALLHLCVAITPLLAERDMQLQVGVDSVVGAAMSSSDEGAGTAPRLEIWSDPFEPERTKVQFGALQSSWRYGRAQFTASGHGWSGALAARLFASDALEEHDPTCLAMAMLGDLMLDLGGVVMIDTCPQRQLVVTLLWPARIASEVAAPLEIDTTEDDLDALIIHEAEMAAESLSRRLAGLGLRVASTTSPETGLDLIAEMGARCRSILIGETPDSALAMKVAAIRPDATILTLRAAAEGQGAPAETWELEPDRDALDRLAARLRRRKTAGPVS